MMNKNQFDKFQLMIKTTVSFGSNKRTIQSDIYQSVINK